MQCPACQSPIRPVEPSQTPAAGLCETCLAVLSSGKRDEAREVLEAINAPVLLMQPEPRQVFTANKQALALFCRTLEEAERRRGGEVFGCVHSFSREGCGKDAHCGDCKIKAAIVSGFAGPASAVSTLMIRRGGGDAPHVLAVSVEQTGSYALARIERFESEDGEAND
jgi:hypothetical protein